MEQLELRNKPNEASYRTKSGLLCKGRIHSVQVSKDSQAKFENLELNYKCKTRAKIFPTLIQDV